MSGAIGGARLLELAALARALAADIQGADARRGMLEIADIFEELAKQTTSLGDATKRLMERSE